MANILVTSATGRVGSALIPKLIEKGHKVTGLTSRQAGIGELEALGARAIMGDMRKPEELEHEFGKADAIFLAMADDLEQDKIERDFVAAVEKCSQPHIVKLSAQSAGLNPPVSFGRQHRNSEMSLEQSGLNYTILRPTFFMQSLLLFADDIKQKNKIIAPVGSGRAAMVDVEDVANAAACVLADQNHYKKTYTITGSSAHSFKDVAELLTSKLGRTIGHVSPPGFVAKLVLPFFTDMPRWISDLVVELMTAIKNGAQEPVSNDLELLTGKPGKGLNDFIDQHIQQFSGT